MIQQARALAPPRCRFHVPVEGRWFLLITVVLLVIGLVKTINLLALLACMMLALWVLNALLAGRRLRHLSAHRYLGRPIFAGKRFCLEISLHNQRRRSEYGLHLDDHGPEPARTSWLLPVVSSRATLRLAEEMMLGRRGRQPWGPLVVSSGYPFGLARREIPLTPSEEIIVLPRLGRLHRGRLRRFLARSSLTVSRSLQHPRRHPSAQAEFHGLRAFRSGDSPRWIHWRTSARCGELMVREFEDVPSDNLILVLDLSSNNEARGTMNDESHQRLASDSSCIVPRASLLEDAISLAATICWEWCRQKDERFVLAVAGTEPAVLDGITGNELGLRMLECLAVQEEAAAADRTGLLERLAQAPLPRGPVLAIGLDSVSLGRTLYALLNRPVVSLDVANLSQVDFYERPAIHAS